MESIGEPLDIHVLLGHDVLGWGIGCLRSLNSASVESIQLVVHEDGSLSTQDRLLIETALPVTGFVSASESDEKVRSALSNYPNAEAFRRDDVLSKKLIDIPLIANGDFVYCDADILFVRRFFGLREACTNGVFTYMFDRFENSSIFFMDQYVRRTRVPVAQHFNSGLMSVPGASYDLEFVDWFLGVPQFRRHLQIVEQTCWGILAARTKKMAAWDPRQVTFPSQRRDDDGVVAVHYIGELRGGLEGALTSNRILSAPDVKLQTIAMRPLTLGEAVMFRIRRRLSLMKANRRGNTHAGA
jgi:hypothetical protein